MTTKKTIGIVGYRIGESGFGVGANYLEFISHYGVPRIIMPHEKHVDLDLLILPGGADLSPNTYGEYPRFHTGNPDVFKEHFFRENLKNYVGNTPIFGICLGMQMLNVYFNGQLVQDLKFHAQSSGRWSTAHKVYKFDELTGKPVKKFQQVNSHHHQCVTFKTLGQDLKVEAVAPNDEGLTLGSNYIVEAFTHRTLPIAAVQWHPKFFGAC